MRPLREIFHWPPPWARHARTVVVVVDRDCLLCPGKVVTLGCTLLGMIVCKRCTKLHLRNAKGNWVEIVPRDIMLWAIKVHHVRMEQALEKFPLRVATRMTLARLMGLEVDLTDLFDYPHLHDYLRIGEERRRNDG